MTGTSLVFGTSNEMGAQGVLTTASAQHPLPLVQQCLLWAKDAGAVTVITQYQEQDTRTVNQAMCAANYN